MLELTQISTGYEVSFIYKPWLVDAIKKIPNVKWNPSKKNWFVPNESSTALLNWSKQIGGKVAAPTRNIEIGEIEPLPELDIEIPLKRSLYHYQSQGVAYALKHKKVIVGDEPGLGKTFQSIATLVGANVKCVLVICPATLKDNWVNEWRMNAGWSAMEITDRIKISWAQYYRVGICKVFVVNYESLKKYFVESINKPEDKPLRLNHIKFRDTINLFDAVIIDELHRCKSSKTLQSKLVAGICKGKEYILGLTGTPIQNKPADLWPQLGIIQQIDNFGGYKGFVDRYCDGPTQSSNLKELNYLLNKHCFYRRAKRDVLKDLPKMTRNIHKVSISNRTEYVKAENNFIEYLRENLQKTEGEIDTALRGQAMVLIGILKKISARGKIEQVLEHIQEVTDAGEKIVVFCWHKEIVDELKKHLPHAVTVVGSDPQEKRQAAVHDFQKCKKCNIRLENHKDTDHEFIPSDTKVIICNIKSGGVGITLTASSRVIHHELPWTAADCEQDESRCDRISQRFPVESGYFLGANTIDEYIYDLIDKKRNIANQVTGAVEEVETNMVDEFINLFTKAKF
jgi:SWI/SNF-related matrix-associated actin-dependent regulator 1 of chromatin subfamily A